MRFFSFFIMLVGLLTAFAGNAVTFSVSPTPQTVAGGSSVSVDVVVADFTNIAGYQFSMTWDPAVLQFQSATPVLSGMSVSDNFNTGNSAAGVLSHLFFAQNGTPLTLPDGSVLFSLNFIAVGAAGASSPISFTATPTPKAAYNGGLQPLTVTALEGIVHISAQGGFSVSGDVARANGTPVPAVLATMSGDAAGSGLTGVAGDYGFENLVPGSNLTITPTSTADPLECVSVRDILFIYKHILGLEALPNPYAMAAADANRSRSITSFDAVELRKLILGIYTELPNNTSWQFIPADYVFPNPNNPFQEIFPESAQVTDLQADEVRDFVAIKTGDVTDCSDDAQGPAFMTALASNANGQPGQQVTVDVTVQDFADVSGLQFSLQWDPAVAQFAGLSNFGLPGLDNAAFNTDQAAAGKLSLCWWTDVLSGGQTLPNNSLLFSIAFTLTGPAGSSTPLAFVQTPTKFEVVNGNCAPFELNTGNGLILVSNQPPPPTALQLVSGNAISTNYAPVCVPVTASNFSDLTSVQFPLGWDPAVFEYLQVQNFNQLLGLSSANVVTNQSWNGRLAVSWSDPNANGVSLPNGTTLFEVCFTPVGSQGASTPFGFPGSPVPTEATDADANAVPVQTTAGTLSISAANTNAPFTVFVSPTPQTVAVGAAVSVDIRAANFTDIAGYQFSMTWDPAVLQFLSATPVLSGMSVSDNFNTGNSAAGVLSHLFFAQNGTPLTLPDGSVLFSLNFIAVGAAGTSSPISFTATPTLKAAYNGGLQPLTVTALEGIVHISAQGGFSVSGDVARANGTPVPAVLATLGGDATGSDLTDATGHYGFANLAPGSDLSVTPSKTVDPTECVSVRDILFIYKHFLGIEQLPNPYSMAAADANRSRSITSFDAVELRKLILGIYTELPNAPSWQFIRADYVFPNPNNPFQEIFPESAQVTDLQAAEVRDFVAIKTGDVTDCTDDAHGAAFMTALASNANGQQGQQVTIDVTVQGFTDVSGLQFSLQWDPTVAQFVGLGNFNPTLPGLDAGTVHIGESGAGKLSLCWWSSPTEGPKTLSDGDVLFSLTFTLVGPPGSSTPVAFVQTPTKFEVVNGACAPFDLNTDNGLISVSSQPPPPAGIHLVSGNATSLNGAPVCAPVCVSGFTDVASAQFTLGWDPAVFSYQQVQNFHPALGLNNSNFNAAQSTSGLLTFSWADPSATGVTLPNGTVLFEVCFAPLGSNGSSTPLAFPNAPAQLEFYYENGNIVPAQTTSGTLNIVSSGASPITVSVSPNAQTVPTGTPVSVDIQVSNFTDIVGYQFSMAWDPAVLQFQSVVPAPGDNFNIGNSANGVLTHLFYVQGLDPLTLPDGSALFTLNFVAVGAAGTSSTVEFTAVPTPIRAYNAALQPVQLITQAGVVHISAGVGEYSVSGTIARPGGTPVPGVTVELSGDASGSDLTGAPGEYLFDNLPAGSNLTVTPAKNTDPTECVSVRDILFIFKHIFGIMPLPNPYSMAAADVNSSRSITTFDVVELRKLILGIYSELPNNTSWQFIPADYIFPNPNNPFVENFPESAQVTDLQADEVRDFVAVKTGDVTNCVGDEPGPAFLTTLASSASGHVGQQVTIDVTVQDFSDVSGLQFSLQWDPAVAKFDGLGNLNPVLPGLNAGSIFTGQSGSGHLSVCWYTDLFAGSQTLPNGSVLFSLTFTLVGPPGSSTPVAFVETPTKFEVVDENCDPFGLNSSNGLISVFGNEPCSITCPTGVPALTANSSCQAVLGDYTGLAQISGDCDSDIPVVQSPAPGKIVNPGTVAITLTVSNTAGQSAKCVFNVAISGGCH